MLDEICWCFDGIAILIDLLSSSICTKLSTMNARTRIKLCRFLLLIGLFITFLTSLSILVLHEYIINTSGVQSYPFFHADSLITTATGIGESESNPIVQQLGSILQPIDDEKNNQWPPILSAYTEPISATNMWYDDASVDKPQPKAPLPMRHTQSRDLTHHTFPKISYTPFDDTTTSTICNNIPSLLPIDDFESLQDPYLPWIHDLFISADGTHVNIIAQNRRRCHKGKFHMADLKFWEGQVALFQPVAVRRLNCTHSHNNTTHHNDGAHYRLSSHDEADTDGIETRFICRFKLIDYTSQTIYNAGETLSNYPFNYEFINWRKMKSTMVEDGKEQSFFWLSPLMFNCPIPTHLQQYTSDSTAAAASLSSFMLDIIPIRTPTRRNDRDGYFFHKGHGGPMTYNATEQWGRNHILPQIKDSGRWENLPICSLKKPQPVIVSQQNNKSKNEKKSSSNKKPHRLVACTWTSALHQRRGNERRISDGKARLREWITFNLQVGFDHIYIFDNTGANGTIFRLKNEVDPDFGNDTSPQYVHDDLSSVTDLFPSSQVTRIDWPATICNNNRPNHNDPGERSSQYAAEAACRTRYGPDTDWMASMDPDEYFVPMGNYTSWKEILDKIDRDEGRKVLKFRSTRARPLLSTLVPTFDEGAEECTHKMAKEGHNQCLMKSDDKTYLETYNCEYIKSPKPERFARAMKQFYRPDFVLSHFVHYSTVTVSSTILSIDKPIVYIITSDLSPTCHRLRLQQKNNIPKANGFKLLQLMPKLNDLLMSWRKVYSFMQRQRYPRRHLAVKPCAN